MIKNNTSFNIKFLIFLVVYGCSEVGPVIMTPMSQEKQGKMIGKIIPNTKVRLRDIITGNDIDVPFKEGEVLIKGLAVSNILFKVLSHI